MSGAAQRAAGAGAGPSPLSRPLPRGDRQINGSSFAFLFAELIAYFQTRISTAADLENKRVRRPCPTCRNPTAGAEPRVSQLSVARAPSRTPDHAYPPWRVPCLSFLARRLQAAGYGVGQRVLELLALRERPAKRETTVVGILQFLSGTVWMQLFGRTADALEKSTDQANACGYIAASCEAAVPSSLLDGVRLAI
jgi:hypothetical protein